MHQVLSNLNLDKEDSDNNPNTDIIRLRKLRQNFNIYLFYIKDKREFAPSPLKFKPGQIQKTLMRITQKTVSTILILI